MTAVIDVDDETFGKLLDSEAVRIADCSIGFVLKQIKGNAEQGVLGGSATLVSIDGAEGILTAEHVVRRFRDLPQVGLIVVGYRQGAAHRLAFDPKLCRDISFRAEGEAKDGPDLSFLVPPPDITAVLRAMKTFYNLSRRQEAMLERATPRDHGFWAIAGMADEWTTDAPPQMGIPNIKSFYGRLLGALDMTRWYSSAGSDYAVFEARYGEGYGGPQSFGGYSGGGLWQFVVKPDASGPVVVSRHLMGVAFYQSPVTSRGGTQIREITCHSRESIYRVLIERVRADLGRERQSAAPPRPPQLG